jgi:hypothetical protein
MAKIKCELADIVSLFECRLGETNDLALSARTVEEGFAALARRIHMQSEVANGNGAPTTEEVECRKKNQRAEVTM